MSAQQINQEIVAGIAQALWDTATGTDGDDAPDAAMTAARALANLYTTQNDRSLYAMFRDTGLSDDAFEFGYRLGVLDVENKLVAPEFEVSIDGDYLNWTGGARDALLVNPAPTVRLFQHPQGAVAHPADPAPHLRATARYGIDQKKLKDVTPIFRRKPLPRGKQKRRNPAGGGVHFDKICKKCKRAISELKTEPGTFVDATELSSTCPEGGEHQPYGVAPSSRNPHTARVPSRR